MPAIHFIQYLRPNGRKTLVSIDRPAPVVARADFILRHGFRFEYEQLTTGDVSLTISDDDGDYFRQLAHNGSSVPEAVDSLILVFDVPTALKRRKENRDG